jgi:hypothetical protein
MARAGKAVVGMVSAFSRPAHADHPVGRSGTVPSR